MTDKTLYERMREAADTLIEVALREYPITAHRDNARDYEFTADSLCLNADKFEREDAEKAAAAAALDAQVEELASTIYHSRYPGPPHWDSEREIIRDVYRDSARAVIAAGWRKTKTQHKSQDT